MRTGARGPSTGSPDVTPAGPRHSTEFGERAGERLELRQTTPTYAHTIVFFFAGAFGARWVVQPPIFFEAEDG